MNGGAKFAFVVVAWHLAVSSWEVLQVQAQDKPDAAFGRVAVLGAIEDTERAIIGNRLETLLSRHYDLVPRAEYAAAEEEAFQTIEEQACTEENCIRLIQGYLQVERIYVFQMVRQGELTQLTMALFKEDTRRVEEDICEECSLTELRDRAEQLTLKLVEEDLAAIELLAAAEDETSPAESERSESFTPGLGILLTSLGLGAVAAFQYSEAVNLDDEARAKADTDPRESSDLEQQRDDAATLAIVAGLAAVSLFTWYLVADDPQDVTASSQGWHIQPWILGDREDSAWGVALVRRW